MYIQYDVGRRVESMTSMNICREQSTTTIRFFYLLYSNNIQVVRPQSKTGGQIYTHD